ncbi:aminotransferase class I/II-fold pyridoxal phosphate-dependent enzyme [Streptomyces sp. ICN441]|uniref:pyridoxal phosphate-dependent aminotransferase n=1 Tax=Streptomyces sp. ICN441 TaxID=2558286 RepID=UPI00106A37CA|nr:aminotransferase class I/II-fold pyridoxal phosphate-dependent enzyme [Streptomyces sp. ICN441]TFE52269.1 aminotransferase class I/II-fold pyridoxal phosphate-dependent enzyme [Streptomyces sp. ICN441]
MTTHSATLAVDEAVQARRAAGHDVLHLGFGEAGVPVAPGLAEVLTDAHLRNGYGPVAGSPQVRAAAAGWFTRRGLSTEPGQILFAPGSKPLLFALLAAIGGDVVLPCPSWVSYAAQAALLGRRVVSVPVPAEAGGIPDPELLERALRQAHADGARPGVLVLTVPDNPTGTVAPAEQVEAVCAVAGRHGLAVISDEIYAELSHHGTAPSPVRYLAERTVVTTGLSKSLALGGWRIGFARTPAGSWGRRLQRELTGVASEIWSSLAAPMQAVAAHALDDPPEVTAHIAAARRLHARIAAEVHTRLRAAGALCRPPQAGFYLYPDFGPAREALRAQGITTGTDLATALLDRHGIATLPGSAFGEPGTALTLRLATSLLYGTTPQQRHTALTAREPETLPWISPALTSLSAALTELTAGRHRRPRS